MEVYEERKKDSYGNPSVGQVVVNVLVGIRSREDLKACGCPICQEAMRILRRKR